MKAMETIILMIMTLVLVIMTAVQACLMNNQKIYMDQTSKTAKEISYIYNIFSGQQITSLSIECDR